MSNDGFFDLKIRSVTLIGEELLHLVVETAGTPVDTAPRKPGQYVRMTAGEEKPGYFAIASGPAEKGALAFVLKKGVPLVDRLAGMKPGDTVRSTGPEGNGYPLDKVSKDSDLWLFAMGTGITPIRPVIEYALVHPGCAKSIHLYYGCRKRNQIPFEADLARWKSAGIDVKLVISGESHVHVQNQFAKEHPKAAGIIFACGKKEMIAELKSVADSCGIGQGNIYQNF